MTKYRIDCTAQNAQVANFNRAPCTAVKGGCFELFFEYAGDTTPYHISMVFGPGDQQYQAQCEKDLLEVLGTKIDRLKGWQLRVAINKETGDVVGIGNLFEDRWFHFHGMNNDQAACPISVEINEINCFNVFEPVNMHISKQFISDDDHSVLAITLKLTKGNGSTSVLYCVRFNEDQINVLPAVMRQIKSVAGVEAWNAVAGRNVRVRRDTLAGELVIGHITEDVWVRASDIFNTAA